MAESLLQELRRYVGLSQVDEQELQRFLPLARPHFPAVVERFYDQILQHEGASKVLRATDQIARLKLTLLNWLERLLGGPWDQDYMELRSRIGRAHVKVQLAQRYMVTAMSGVHQNLCEIAHQVYGDDLPQIRKIRDALSRITSLDLAVMLESYRDITLEQIQRLERVERAVLAERLEVTEERYLAVIENAPILVILLDSSNGLVFCNRKAEELTGWRRSEVSQLAGLHLLIHPADLRKARNALAKAREGALPPPFETRVLSRDGEEHRVRWHLRLQPGTGDSQVLGIGVDVTEERSLEERTRRSERLASLGTLAAGLAHEIRNPLNAAQLQLTLLERRIKKQQDVGDGAALIREELLRLAHLVQDFLAFARPTKLRLVALDLRSTVSAVLDLVAPEARERGVTLDHKVGGDPVVVHMDEERIKQVLLNLIRNGMEAVAEQHGRVQVRILRRGGHVLLEVADTGPGIPEGVSVFEPFSSTKAGGTGLGLPIVHRIASDHGGEITLERTSGETIFRVELPIEGPPN